MEGGKNKSSILKPQKPRNPLSDLDLIESVDDDIPITTGRSSMRRISMRRVSFASSNFIKEFATDPEKNTIWDTTYEELLLNKSDHTPSSDNLEEKSTKNIIDLEQSQIVIDEKGSVDISLDTSLCSTEPIINPIIASKSKPIVSILNEDQKEMQDVVTLQKKTDIQNKHPFNQMKSKENKDEFINDKENINAVKRLPTSTKKQCFLQSNIFVDTVVILDDQHTNFEIINKSKELGKNENRNVVQRNSILKKPNKGFGENEENTISSKEDIEKNESMKFTQSVSDANLNKSISLIKDIKRNRTIINEESMELTQHISMANKSLKKNKTVLSDENMELTRSVSNNDAILNKSISFKDVKRNRTVIDEESMELTQHMSMANKSLKKNKTVLSDENMELTRSVSNNDAILNKSISFKDVKRNRTVIDEESMELTQHMSMANKSLKKNKTVLSGENMELTRSVSNNDAILNKSISFKDVKRNRTVVDEESMELTQHTSMANKSLKKNKTVLSDENMELTRSVSDNDAILNKSISFKDIKRNRTVVNEESMELTQHMSVANKSIKKNKTVLSDEDMELTQSASDNDAILNKSVSFKDIKRNRIIVTEESMDPTQYMSMPNKSMKENKTIDNHNLGTTMKSKVHYGSNKSILSEENVKFVHSSSNSKIKECESFNISNMATSLLNEETTQDDLCTENCKYQLPSLQEEIKKYESQFSGKNPITATEEHMEFTENLPVIDKTKTSATPYNQAAFLKSEDFTNRTILNEECTELTQKLPLIEHKFHPSLAEESRQQHSENLKSARLSINCKNKDSNESFNVSKIDTSLFNKETSQNDLSTESFKYQLPSLQEEIKIFESELLENNKIILTEEHTEFTENIPVIDKIKTSATPHNQAASLKTVDRTILNEECMELTQKLPLIEHKLHSSLAENSRQQRSENLKYAHLSINCKNKDSNESLNISTMETSLFSNKEIPQDSYVTESNTKHQLPSSNEIDFELQSQLPGSNTNMESFTQHLHQIVMAPNEAVLSEIKDSANDEHMESIKRLPTTIINKSERSDQSQNSNLNESMEIEYIMSPSKTGNVANKTTLSEECMDFTQHLPFISKSIVENKHIGPYPNLSKIKGNNTIVMEECMEFTQQLPIVIKNIKKDETLSKTKIIGGNKTVLIDECMEFTQQLPLIKKNDIEEHHAEPTMKTVGNKTILTEECMDFTHYLTPTNESIIVEENIKPSQAKFKGNKTILNEECMEFTQYLPLNNPILVKENTKQHELSTVQPIKLKDEPSSKIPSISYKTILTEEGMEFTEQLPIVSKDMELGQHLSQISQNIEELKNVTTNDFTLEMEIETNGEKPNEECLQEKENLEMASKTQTDDNRTIVTEGYMEFAKSLPICNKNVIENKLTSTQEMELTQNLLMANKHNTNEENQTPPSDTKNKITSNDDTPVEKDKIDEQNLHIEGHLPITSESIILKQNIEEENVNVKFLKIGPEDSEINSPEKSLEVTHPNLNVSSDRKETSKSIFEEESMELVECEDVMMDKLQECIQKNENVAMDLTGTSVDFNGDKMKTNDSICFETEQNNIKQNVAIGNKSIIETNKISVIDENVLPVCKVLEKHKGVAMEGKIKECLKTVVGQSSSIYFENIEKTITVEDRGTMQMMTSKTKIEDDTASMIEANISKANLKERLTVVGPSDTTYFENIEQNMTVEGKENIEMMTLRTNIEGDTTGMILANISKENPKEPLTVMEPSLSVYFENAEEVVTVGGEGATKMTPPKTIEDDTASRIEVNVLKERLKGPLTVMGPSDSIYLENIEQNTTIEGKENEVMMMSRTNTENKAFEAHIFKEKLKDRSTVMGPSDSIYFENVEQNMTVEDERATKMMPPKTKTEDYTTSMIEVNVSKEKLKGPLTIMGPSDTIYFENIEQNMTVEGKENTEMMTSRTNIEGDTTGMIQANISKENLKERLTVMEPSSNVYFENAEKIIEGATKMMPPKTIKEDTANKIEPNVSKERLKAPLTVMGLSNTIYLENIEQNMTVEDGKKNIEMMMSRTNIENKAFEAQISKEKLKDHFTVMGPSDSIYFENAEQNMTVEDQKNTEMNTSRKNIGINLISIIEANTSKEKLGEGLMMGPSDSIYFGNNTKVERTRDDEEMKEYALDVNTIPILCEEVKHTQIESEVVQELPLNLDYQENGDIEIICSNEIKKECTSYNNMQNLKKTLHPKQDSRFEENDQHILQVETFLSTKFNLYSKEPQQFISDNKSFFTNSAITSNLSKDNHQTLLAETNMIGSNISTRKHKNMKTEHMEINSKNVDASETINGKEIIKCTSPTPMEISFTDDLNVSVEEVDHETENQNKNGEHSQKLEFNGNYEDKTPNSSRLSPRTNYIPYSPCADDTQHLINCSLSHKPPTSDFSKIMAGDELNPSFLCSRFMPLSAFGSEAFPLSLESTRYNLTHHDYSHHDKEINTEKSSRCLNNDNTENHSKLKRKSLEDLETDQLQKKPLLETNTKKNELTELNVEPMEVSSLENESIHISQENLTLSDTFISPDDSFVPINSVIPSLTENSFSIEKNLPNTSELLYKSSDNYNNLWQSYLEKTQLRRKKFEEFGEKMLKYSQTLKKSVSVQNEVYKQETEEYKKPYKVPNFEEIELSSNSSVNSESESTEEQSPFLHIGSVNSTADDEKVLTLQEKIEAKYKRSKCYWNILSIDDNKCEFDTLYKTIRLIVDIDKETEIVSKTNIICRISADNSDAVALFVHKIFKDRLSPNNIQAAVGERYDVLTLLDYVYMNMQKMLELLNEFDDYAKRYGLVMDKEFKVRFKIVNFFLRNTWCVTVDMSNVDNITDSSVEVFAKVGSVKEEDIKGLARNCSRGLSFLSSFINSILTYADLQMKRKNIVKTKALK